MLILTCCYSTYNCKQQTSYSRSIYSNVSRILFQGVQIFFGKVGVFAKGFGSMLSQEKGCNLMRFGEYFTKIL